MQVRTGNQPGAANKAENFPLGDTPALSQSPAESRQVRVQSFIPIGMAHNRDVAIASLVTDESDMTISSDAYPGTDGRAVVDPLVGAPSLEHRVEACVCESGSYARELDRGTQKGLAHIAAVRSVVAVSPLIVAKKYSLERMTLIDEFG